MTDEGENANVGIAHNRYRLLAMARRYTFGHGVTGCLLHPIAAGEGVSVKYNDLGKRAAIGNVQTCKSVWACPVCADRITRFRAAELLSGMERWNARGNAAALATYTISHNNREGCKTVLDRLQIAYRRFKSGRLYQSLKRDFSVEGSIRALELTIGANGWHWHIHELFFVAGEDKKRFKPMLGALRPHWLNAVEVAGGSASVKHGFSLSPERRAAFDYVAKFGSAAGARGVWNAAREVVRSPAKMREDASGGLHPFAVLASIEANVSAAGVWNEYVRSTSGTRQLRYSTGCKTLLGIGEVGDAEIIEAETTAADRVLARIPSRGWYYLNNLPPAVLNEFYGVINTGDAPLLWSWLDNYDVPFSEGD